MVGPFEAIFWKSCNLFSLSSFYFYFWNICKPWFYLL